MGGASVEQQQELFPLGSLVEVKTDEEGFKGVFFVATVVPSTPLPKRKNGRKSFKKIHVEYHNLLASEDGSDRLRESVDVSFVRPAPPPQEDFEGFGLNDSVDAFYKDGWWTGIIARVLEGGRFIVTFQNPPDELEFGLSELRVHWDWCDGSWFRPEKQGITGLMFEVGRKVEVSFDVEDFLCAWFPSTIDTVLTNGTYLVEYHSSNISNEDQFLKATVDYLHVRPCPPFLKDKSYVLLEKVDCFFNFGWWNGVITKVLEDCRYVVFFKQKNEEKEFHQSELRPHMDWKESKWFTSSSQLRKPQNLFGKDYSTSRISEKSRTPTLLLESSEPDCGGLPCAEINSPGLGISRGKRGGYRSSSKKIWRPRSDQIRHSNVSAIEDMKNSKQTETGNFSQKRKRGRPRKELINNPHVLVTGNPKNGSVASSYICRKDGDSHNEVVMTDNNLAFNEPNDELADGSDHKNSNKSTKRTFSGVHNEKAMKESMKLAKSPSKRGGRQRVEGKTIEANCLTGALEKVVDEIPCNVSDEQLSKWIEVMQTPTRKDSVVGKTIESNSTLETIDEVPCHELDEPLSKWIEGMRTPIAKDSDSIDQSLGKTIELNCLTVALENVDEVPFDELDEPLSKWIEVMQTPATIKYSGVLPVSPVEECVEKNDNAVSIDGSEKQKKSGVQPRARDDTCATVPSEQEDLPFAKNDVLWKTINSMDILQRIPQRPHFRPLIHLKESSREGLAIGYMVTFSRVVEKASSLQINDPKSITDEILETLEELEKYGFDVKVVEDCVGQMLEVKHKQEELREEAKGIGSQISHHNLEKQKIDEEIGEMRRQILMLQEKLLVAASVQEKEESIIAPLQSKLQKVEEDIKIMELEFLNLAASL
ncbi:DUF724 domain-containing protein 3-like isoform X10 [Primulina huaijiensis]|uniref:DUF724 domain-containing protein 3-like isoform X10 n=1 Tax=Primulina huaijiensis TaxID=1492673 RepID=UPI003CC76616